MARTVSATGWMRHRPPPMETRQVSALRLWWRTVLFSGVLGSRKSLSVMRGIRVTQLPTPSMLLMKAESAASASYLSIPKQLMVTFTRLSMLMLLLLLFVMLFVMLVTAGTPSCGRGWGGGWGGWGGWGGGCGTHLPRAR